MVKITKSYKYATAKQVIFQIRYSNLFMIGSKIGDIQLKLMKEFPKSSKVIKHNILFANITPDTKIPSISDQPIGNTIWRFESSSNYLLEISSNTLSISSTKYKSYQRDPDNSLREVIIEVMKVFLEYIPILVFERIGLRYIDECPMPKDKNNFLKLYNSTFPLSRFGLNDAKEIAFFADVKREENYLRFGEKVKIIDGVEKLYLDFDGYAQDVNASDYLNVLDELHELITEEYGNSIKDPIIKYMETGKLDE
ncbi:TIGR04255 family protein [Promethearchaeum syntrophicum]|uniref:TIGR04255 family protein n=1 Tax=Promethearchaeum syntrophicum TaxID=2594042 RepID=A0A5B9DAK3_9ARCH|nr:TIGR04255 family protein [Candidatus Prometheoarchaeum syntrophicum]QEE15626.1 hypothetical protein DSAG12_01452 [Candidatus Prometheoarchaeum syntrophicum]